MSLDNTPFRARLERLLLLAGTLLPSPLRIALLRALGHRVGKRVRIAMLTVLCAEKITIDDEVRIGPLNIIRSGSEVTLGYSSEISFMVIIHGRGAFRLGERSYVSVQTFIDLAGGVTIGSYSGTGPRTMIFSHAIYLPPSQGYPRVVREIRIGNYAWLGGMNFLTAGAVVKDHVMTAPGAVISGHVGPDVFWISKDTQIPLHRICRRMDRNTLTALAHEILSDFAKTQGLRCVVDGPRCVIGGHAAVLIGDGTLPDTRDAIAVLLEDAPAPPHRPWYNLVTLRCGTECTGSFHRKLQEHMRKYFGLHFLPADRHEVRR